MIRNFFDKSFYINRKDRVDRKEKFENELKKVNLLDWVERYEAVHKDDIVFEGNRPSKSEIACGTSHRNIVEMAKNQNWNNVLIFEDDACFLDNFHEVCEKSLNQIRDIEWDIFYFSCRLFDRPINKISENLIKIGACYCCHAYSINKKAYEKYLNYDPTKDPIDVFILKNNFKKYGSYPLCVSVYASNSNIVNGFVCYDNILKESYGS